jgi:hypothetical protein
VGGRRKRRGEAFSQGAWKCAFEDRQAVVQLLVEKVVVHPNGAVEVHHVLPFEEQPVVADQKKSNPD